MSFTKQVPGATADMIPALIGRGGATIKKVKSESWNMWNAHQEKGEGVGETKPTLKIKYEDDKEKNIVMVTIESESETMRKFCWHALKRSTNILIKRRSFVYHIFYAHMKHDLIGRLMGRGAKAMIKLLDDVKESMKETYGEEKYQMVRSTRWELKSVFLGTSGEQWHSEIEANDRTTFMGHFDREREVVSLRLSSKDIPKEHSTLFDDMMHRYYLALEERIGWVNAKEEENERAIEDALAFDFNDDEYGVDIDEGYTPDSPK